MAMAEGEEAPIAAFAVAKGGVVLKNIFLNAPPPETRRGGGGDGEEEEDTPVLFGRHPDCHVLVDHPSVSRFHLEVRSRRRQRRITVTDLSSVHGTWVSGRRIPANTPVELATGDTLRLGGSKREYRLHWLSLREAFEIEDPLPPLLEEDKEEFRTYQEASKQLVPGQRESVDTETHQETSQQILSEQIDFWAEVIPSAPPLPEFAHFFSLEESSLSQFDENREGVIEEKLVDENPITESVVSSITQAMPATMTNAGRQVQSDKRDASSAVFRRAKLKPVKSLRVDTGRSKVRSRTLSYNYQKEEALNENLVCSENCGRECAACTVLVDENPIMESVVSSITQEMPATMTNAERQVQSDKRDASSAVSRRAKLKLVKSLRVDTGYNYQKEEALNENLVCSENCGRECAACMVLFDNSDVKKAEEKENMVAPYKGDMNPHVSDSITMEVDSKEFMHCVSPLNLEHDTFSDKENSMLNDAKEIEQNDFISENSIPQDSIDAKLQKRSELLHSVSPLVFKDDALADNEIPQLYAIIHMGSSEPVSENNFMQDIVGENTNSHKDMKHDGLSPLNLDGSLSNKENMAQNDIIVGPEYCDLEGTIFGNLFDNLDIKGTEKNEESSPLDKENTTPYISGNIIMERSQLRLKPIISQELMDSISPLNLEHDNFSDNENSMLNIGKQIKSNELLSKNLTPLISVDATFQKSQTGFMPISHLDFEDDILPDKENSVLAPGKYDAISPVRQGNLFSDKENVTPASRDPKPIGRRVLGSRMNKSASTEYTEDDILPDKENSVLAPGKYDAISPVRQGDPFSDKENVTPASRDLKPIGRRVLCSRMNKSVSTEYTSDRSINKPEYNELSAKSKGFHTVDDDVFYSDKENLTPVSSGGMKARRCLPKNLTVDGDQDQEAFYSDKENLTPASSAAQKTRDMSENRARIESVITKKRVVDSLPFQTLLSNSPLRHTSSLDCKRANARAADFAAGDVAIRLEDELNSLPHKNQESDRVGEGLRIWTMVTDTNCLLDDETRKSIMLLQGLKGTRLIIPMIVIRELDCMKQREGLFRRSSKATSILQWIEECMENESWWIHVQSSSEMSPVAPTPPATPTTQCNDEEKEVAAGTFNPMAFFSPRSFTDTVSPKTEDRILDCALLFSKLRSNQNIIILSKSITLKIKAMAEGLLCEGANEFRETLMNPCSSRFMWAASAPRGSAWSCLDETALAENYYNSHHGARRRIPRSIEAAKGLKLILLHNSLYAQATNSVKTTPLAPLAS